MGKVASSDSEADTPVRFCTLADANFYPGLVALVNSLRLQGHDDPISVLDLGLTPGQRATLAGECEFVAVPPGPPRHPWLLEPVACRARSAEIVVYIDADIIVTRPLHDLIERARSGHVVAFPDELPERWFAEWQDIFDLPRAPRHQVYVNAGFLAVSTVRHPTLLDEWARCCEAIIGRPTVRDDRRNVLTPVGLSSQDALNAILMSEIAEAALDVQPFGAEVQKPQLRQAKVHDVHTLWCTFEGRPVTLLHHWGVRKPWNTTVRGYTVNAYSTCLRRLLVADDVAVPVDPREVPRWLRPGPVGVVAHALLHHALPAARRVVAPLRRRGTHPAEGPPVVPVTVDASNR